MKRQTLLTILSVFCLLAKAGVHETLVLNSQFIHNGPYEWRMQRDGEVSAKASEVASVGFDTHSWYPAAVPGTVLTSLVKNGVYPEPYYGTNNKIENALIPDLAAAGREFYTYWFRTEVEIPSDYEGQLVWLEPQGINYRAEVWVNGHLTATIAGMFQNVPINITDFVSPGKKAAIALRIYPVDEPGTTQSKSWGATGEWRNGGNGAIGANVTQLMTVGWDFTFSDGIRDRNTGPWKSILLYATGGIAMRNPFVKSELSHPNYDEARQTVSVDLVNPSNDNRTVTATVRGEITGGITFEKQVRLGRGEQQTVVFNAKNFPQLVIKNPRLWWPKNKGAQPLYDLRLSVSMNGKVCDSLSTRFGIREVQATRETPDKSKLFLINGRRVFVRGSNWIPEAMLRTDDSRMDTELAYTAQSGINLLRLWGGGIAESDRFYELCDSLGIMVWQEFWMTGDTRHPEDQPLYLQNVASTVRRIRNHPSIIFYVSSNESSEVSGAPALLQELDGTRPYQMQSECDGVHDGSPYKQVNPMCHYENTASDRGSRVDGFNPEYGAPSLPIYETLRHMMPVAEQWPINKQTWDYMDGNGFHLMSTLYTDMTNQYGASQGIEEFARKGQLVAAMNAKSIWEVWNRNKLDFGDRFCSGLLFWYHNCPNVQVCARMWDWYLEPTAALYHTMHALEPLHVQFDYLTNAVSVANDYVQSFKNLTVTAEVYDLQSKLVSRQTAKTDVPEDGVADKILTLTFPKDITPVHFIRLTLADAGGKVVSENFYWRSTNEYKGRNTLTGPCTAGFEPLQEMPKANVKATWKGNTVTIKNISKKIAFFNQLLLVDDKGEPVHGTYYSDNFFTLMPGQQRTLTLKSQTETPAARLIVRGWNSPEQIIHN